MIEVEVYKDGDIEIDVYPQGPNTGEKEPVLVEKTISVNGIYEAEDDEADGYKKVNVEVEMPPEPVLVEKNVDSNGTYNASSDNADGYSSVTVNVPSDPYEMLTAICNKTVTAISSTNITAVEGYWCYNCTSLQSVNLPNCASVGDRAFLNCSNLESVVVSNSVTQIGIAVFASCSKLSSFNIPTSVTRIANEAFKGCSSLYTLTIPASVTSIGVQALWNGGASAGQYNLNMLPTSPPTIASNTISPNQTNYVITVPYSADHSILNTYKSASNWAVYADYMVEASQ